MTINQLIKKDADNYVKDNYDGTYTIKVKAISKNTIRPFQYCKYKITECSVCNNTCPQRLDALNNKRAYCTKQCQKYMQTDMNQRKSYKDGWRLKSNGYIMKRIWDDRYKGEWVYQHRYVMEQHLGRELLANEQVHHIDCDKTNNNINNLWLCNISNHAIAHKSIEPLIYNLIADDIIAFNRLKGRYYAK